MAQNRIQCQPGMSMPKFIAQYGTEEQRATVLEQIRWPDGFRCPRCAGEVQLDNAYLGGEHSGGKAGRGSENKVPFVAAVSLTEDEHPLRVKLTPVPGVTFRARSDWSRQHLAPRCTVWARCRSAC